jgi:multidrug resistance efflux pump
MTHRLLVLVLGAIAAPAWAQQDQAVQRELIRRQQQSDAFVQQLHQSQQLLKVAPGDFERRRQLESRQFSERQRLEQASDQQLRDVRPDLPPELRPYERLKADEERRLLVVPAQ